MEKRSFIKSVLALVIFGIGFCSCAFAASPKEESAGKVIYLTKEEFNKKVVNIESNSSWKYLGDKPCILDFYASWCGPCRMISPYLDELAKEYKDQIYIYKIDVDKEKELGRAFGASSIPLLVFIPQDGQPQAARGALPKAELKNALSKNFGITDEEVVNSLYKLDFIKPGYGNKSTKAMRRILP